MKCPICEFEMERDHEILYCPKCSFKFLTLLEQETYIEYFEWKDIELKEVSNSEEN